MHMKRLRVITFVITYCKCILLFWIWN